MSAPPPVDLLDSLAVVAITGNGVAWPSTWSVTSVDIWTGVNRLPTARIILSGGAGWDASVIDDPLLAPGSGIAIAFGQGETPAPLFSGVIRRLVVDASADGPLQLVVEASDKAVAMTKARASAVYSDMTDSDALEQLVMAAGLSAVVSPTSQRHEAIVQYNATPWDFMLLRAKVNNMLVMVKDGVITISAPDTSAAPALALRYGESILAFTGEIDASTPAELDDLAPTGPDGSDLANIRGAVTIAGNRLAAPGNMVGLAGLGVRFNGGAFVSAVHHHLSEGMWRTTLNLGLPALVTADAADVSVPQPDQGLQIGTVVQIDRDPQGEYRVLVTLPFLRTGEGVWARLSTLMAGKGFGSFFYPEIGDKMVLAFQDGDPARPIVLGALFSESRPPPFDPAPDNNIKGVVTRSGLHLDFLDDTKTVQILTPGGRRIVVNDAENAILLSDTNGNSISLKPDGIAIRSIGNIIIDAGLALTLGAGTTLMATGGASAELSASGVVTVKGAAVMLNP